MGRPTQETPPATDPAASTHAATTNNGGSSSTQRCNDPSCRYELPYLKLKKLTKISFREKKQQ